MEGLARSQITVAYQGARVAFGDKGVEHDQPLDTTADDDHIKSSGAQRRARGMIAALRTASGIDARCLARADSGRGESVSAPVL
jgi:hypothetical protein